MHAAFDNTEGWSPMYQRNNKRTGLKNIRCFPYCSDQHIEKGFCGRPIILRVARSYRDQSPPVFAWGEFRRIDEPREVDLGTVVPGELIRSRTKDPKSAKAETLNAPYFEGMVEGGEKCRTSPLVKFVFNQRKKGWNYAWQASKHTAKARHAFFAYLFVEMREEEDSYKCVGVYVSPNFILYCRKRKGEAGGPFFRGAKSGAGGEEDDDEDGFDEDFDEEEEENGFPLTSTTSSSSSSKPPPAAKQTRKSSPQTRKRRTVTSSSSEGAAAASATTTSSRKKAAFHLEPIVSPAKFAIANNGPPSISSTLAGFGGGLTPITAMFVSTWGGGNNNNASSSSGGGGVGDDQASAGGGGGGGGNSRTSNTGTPSTWSGDDSDDIDFDTAQQIDQAVINRVSAVLQRLHAILTADGTAETLGMPQFALDWFINDLEEIADDAFGGGGTSSGMMGGHIPAALLNPTPRLQLVEGMGGTPTGQDLEPLDWNTASSVAREEDVKQSDMVTELAEYLMEETALTAAIRQIIARAEEDGMSSDQRLKAFVRLFQNELSNFLVKRGYAERDLDEALAQSEARTAPGEDEARHTLESLDKHVRHVVETQKRLDSARVNPWVRAVTVRPELDLSGEWRLDDTLLRAFDECRQRRGIPYMMRKLLGYMETRVAITHLPERVVIGLKSKLFASPEVAYELDGIERVWDVAPPVPWPSRLCETYCAWVENDSLRYYHTYNGVSRTERFVKKNASGDRLEIDVCYQEKDVQGNWQTVIFRRGYALRMAMV